MTTKNGGKLLLTMSLFYVGLAMAQPQPTPTPADIVEKVGKSIVHIESTFLYQTEDNPLIVQTMTKGGTGFIIDEDGKIATADHAVNPSKVEKEFSLELQREQRPLLPGSLRQMDITVFIPISAADLHTSDDSVYNVNTFLTASIVKEDDQYDIAILSCGSNLLKTIETGVRLEGNDVQENRELPTFQTAAPRSGDPIPASGFPAVVGMEAGIAVLTTTTGTIANPRFMDSNYSHTYYLVSMQTNPGDSGEPVFNTSDGRIVGFVDAFLNATSGGNSGLALVVPIRHVLGLLAEQ